MLFIVYDEHLKYKTNQIMKFKYGENGNSFYNAPKKNVAKIFSIPFAEDSDVRVKCLFEVVMLADIKLYLIFKLCKYFCLF